MGKLIKTQGYQGDLSYQQAYGIQIFFNCADKDGGAVADENDGTLIVFRGTDLTGYTGSGLILTRNVDGLTGINRVYLSISDAYFQNNNDYTVVYHSVTVDGETVNSVVGHFSIENRH